MAVRRREAAIAATVDRGLQAFEERVANPRTVKQAARLLKNWSAEAWTPTWFGRSNVTACDP